MRLIGLVLALLPVGWWAWDVHYDPCGLQGEAWLRCRTHHQGLHRRADNPVPEPEQ